MKTILKSVKIGILTLMLLLPLAGYAEKPELEWDIWFGTVFDNREGDSDMTDTRTFFQTQLAPEIGVSFGEGRHRLMAGVVWTQPIGTPWKEGSLDPTIYYLYRRGVVKGALGMFPRSNLVRPMPDFVWNDSSYYTQHNIRGGAISIQNEDGFAEGVLDWRGMQTETRREAFNIILRGEGMRSTSIIGGGGLLMMNHLALTRNSPDDEHIVDNFLYNAYLALDPGKKISVLDSLTFRVGILGAVSRHRADTDWHSPVGGWLEADLKWKRLGFHNTLYIGGKLFPYYNEFGGLLDQGAPYYRSNWYERATVWGELIDSPHVNLRASLDFNFAKSNFTFYQRLLLTVNFGSSSRKVIPLYP